MKPIKLAMTAFGPYKDKEVIDFTELNGHRLFLVSGNTGAGKTSIFDAICFALYGEASGEDRSDSRQLRSQFASDDVYTSVEFEFELKNRTYRILRQLPHVKQGNKSATGEKYEFVETTGGREKMMVDRYMVRQINERMQSLIGLTKDQFSQIVMLPQGEFRKLLTSDTENKEEIMRRIFRTHLFKYVAEALNEKRRSAQNGCELAERDLKMHITGLRLALSEREGSELHRLLDEEHYNTHQVLDALDAELAFYEAEKANRAAQLEADIKRHKELLERYHQAAMLNEQFAELERKRSERERRELQLPEMERERARLALAEKTLPLQVQERHAAAAAEDAREKERQLQAAGGAKRQADEAYRAAEEAYKREEGLAERREELVRGLERLNRDLPVVRELDAKRASVERIGKEASQAQAELAAVEGAVAARQEERKKLADQVRALDEQVRRLPEMSEKLERMRAEVKVLQDCLQLTRELRDASSDEAGKQRLFETAAQEYGKLEEAWLAGQAGWLAGHLHDGMPCPVCGSAEHPHKAMAGEDMPSREALEQQRSRRSELESQYLAAKSRRELLNTQLEAKEQEAAALGYAADGAAGGAAGEGGEIERAYQSLVEEGKQLSAAVKQMKADQEAADELKKQLAQAEETMEALQREREEKSASLQSRRTALATEQALYEQALNSVPEAIRSLAALERRLAETEAERAKLEAAWRAAQQQFQQARERQAAAAAELAGAERQLAEASARRDRAAADFDAGLQRAGFAADAEYQQAKLPDAAREELKRAIERFDAELATVRRQAEELEAQLKGKERADLALLSEETARLEQQVEQSRQSLAKAQDHLDRGAEGRERIVQADKVWREAERHYQLVKDLYDVVRGDNRFKISFERYLLIEFLDRILHAANLRLQSISGGQFYLARSDRLEKHGKQSGLGLDVFDNYTGQYRDVKTLSGGEKFNASLCLALGMADVIQAYEGGISLETMFIDEGFGSLDEESLGKAIDTLIELQQTGRMIGIISHVQELKQAIPAVLEVKKSVEGFSYTRFRVS
ncbi:SMC family ATPase [Cohnella lubricantis]|uniref:Nuclease SbcCD subunit C n=1 Tax=Cohnella lubricantis TaxID=2163172 RepID=A0A841T703_9BACL|nr:SMC family ATPase [Cohnella lubricantis]MBB6675826.1 SMC family ATPase [Cohnella lubricantis]MBP2119763.1 exonuclease SbcC [Cohnella lubricantis]